MVMSISVCNNHYHLLFNPLIDFAIFQIFIVLYGLLNQHVAIKIAMHNIWFVFYRLLLCKHIH
jgi:hypothetical protein